MFVGKVLMSMYEWPAKRVADVDLEPIKPGVWAAWAKFHAEERAATPATSTASTGTRVTGPQTPKLAPRVQHG